MKKSLYNFTKIILNIFLWTVNKGFSVLDRLISLSFRLIFKNKVKINDKRVIFFTFQGDYTCNLKPIAQEMIDRKLPYELFWVVNRNTDLKQFPQELKIVKKGSYKFLEAIISSKIIVDNAHNVFRNRLNKSEDQILIQTWHGSLGIKRLDGNVVMDETWKKISEFAETKTDYCISNSQFETDVFHSSYWKNVPILLYGHARNDIFFNNDVKEEIEKKVRGFFCINPETKIFLYAPTHDDGKNKEYLKMDYQKVYETLVKKYGGEWIILLRFHSRLKKASKSWTNNLPPFVKNATLYEDMQELLVATEIGVTDYSSWIFDYMLSGKQGYIFIKEKDNYEAKRGFYYPLESTPFPIAYSTDELCRHIEGFEKERYDMNIKKFLDDKGCIEDGKASKRIVDKIVALLSNN